MLSERLNKSSGEKQLVCSQGSHVLTKWSTGSVEVPALTPVPIQRPATPVTAIVLMDASAPQVQQSDTHLQFHTHNLFQYSNTLIAFRHGAG